VCIVPGQIEALVGSVPGLSPACRIVVDRSSLLERIEVHVQLAPGTVPDRVGRLIQMEAEVRRKLEETLGLPVDVKLGAPGTLPAGAPALEEAS